MFKIRGPKLYKDGSKIWAGSKIRRILGGGGQGTTGWGVAAGGRRLEQYGARQGKGKGLSIEHQRKEEEKAQKICA